MKLWAPESFRLIQRLPIVRSAPVPRSSLHYPKDAHHFTDNLEGCGVAPFDFDWFVLGIFRLQRDSSVGSIKTLHRRLVADQRDDDFAIRRHLVRMNQHV